MRIDVKCGSDTGMGLVEVFLETEKECALDAESIWNELRPLLDAAGIAPGNYVDCFLHKQDADGNWVSVGIL